MPKAHISEALWEGGNWTMVLISIPEEGNEVHMFLEDTLSGNTVWTEEARHKRGKPIKAVLMCEI